MSIKSIKVDGVSHKIDYDALENKPIIPAGPKEIKIINFVVDSDKDDGRPKKDHAYADGKIDSIEIFRYACPERLDIDSTVDTEGNELDKLETHLSYWKDGRPIYARDGDFGYPEIDGTGQFNFRPVFNTPGYVLVPVVKDFNDVLHSKDNPCYNNFKTPWLTGVPGLYRFTKVCKDIKVDMRAVLESELPTNTITYKIIAPADYDPEKIPSVRVFRCSDQVEKYYKYYLHPEKYETLDPELMKGQVLEFVKQETAEGEDQIWLATGYSYSDDTGYLANQKAKVTFLVETDNLEENYSVTSEAIKIKKSCVDELGAQVDNYGNLNPGDYGPTKQLTKIYGDVEVDIRVAPPVVVTYNDEAVKELDLTNPSKPKVIYGFDPENTQKASKGSGFVFTIKHGFDLTDEQIATRTLADALPLIAEITVNGVQVSPADVLVVDSFTKKNTKLRFVGEYVTGDIVIRLAAKVEEEPVEEAAPEQGN